LVGYWKFDEASAGTFGDSSGHGNTGTGYGASGSNNTPQPAADVASGFDFSNSRSLDFDGTDDYITMSRPSEITSSGPATISMWAKFDATPALKNLFNLSDGTNTIMIGYWWNLGNGFFIRNGTSTGNSKVLSSNPDITLWHQWTFVRTGDNNTHKVYVDGVDLTLDQGGSLGDYDVDAFEISRGYNGGYQSDMHVDDVRIYNRALSAGEITELAAGSYTSAVWDGSVDTDWETAGNWDINAVPDNYTNITIANTSNDPLLGAAVETVNLTINGSASLDLNGQGLTVNDSGTFTNNGTLKLQGGETLTNFTHDTDSGSTEYNGSGTYSTLPPGGSYNDLTFSGSGNWSADADVTVSGAMTISDGTYDANTQTTTVTGLSTISGGTYTANTGTQTFNGGLTVSGGTFTGGNGTVDVNGALTVSSGTFTAAGAAGSILVSGDFANTGGTFTHNSGTVTLDGSDQVISGTNTFYNLIKTVTSAATLTWPAGITTTIANTWTAQGASGQVLSLRSSADGTQWKIDPQGTRTITYLDIKDSNNVNATGIAIDDISKFTDSGNNTNWNFNTEPAATAIASISQATDGTGYVSFSTTLSDADSNVTRMKVEYSDDGGTTWYDPDLTSATASTGTAAVDDGSTYQVSSIDTDTGSVTATITWDTQSSSNGNGLVAGRQSDIKVRITPNDSTADGTIVTSSAFTVDNQAPTGLGNLAASTGTGANTDNINVSWTAVNEAVFSHYEIWYGTTLSEVTGRTATEWDNDNDSDLATAATGSTSITNVDPDGIYYVQLSALDTLGNRAVIDAVKVDVDSVAPDIGAIRGMGTLSGSTYYLSTVRPQIIIPATDNVELGEIKVTWEKEKEILGTTSGYEFISSSTYGVDGTSDEVTFRPAAGMQAGLTYRLKLTATDNAGNKAEQTLLLELTSNRQTAQVELVKLDAEKTNVEEIVEALRQASLPAAIDLDNLQRQALLRRKAEAEALREILPEGFGTALTVWREKLTEARGRGFRASQELIANLGDKFAAGFERASSPLTKVFNKLKVNQINKLSRAEKLKRQAGISMVKGGAGWREAGARLADIFRQGRETRIRQGLKNQQEMAKGLGTVLEPVAGIASRISSASRLFSEIVWDKQPTVIANVHVSSLGAKSAVIEWETNHLTRSAKVNYGTSTNYGQEVIDNTVADEHRIEITDLEPNTTYYFEVMNQNGDYTFDAYYTLTTLEPDETALTTLIYPRDAVVRGDESVRVYKKPGESSEAVGEVKPGQRLRALTETEGWISLLMPDGSEGWILRQYVELVDQEQPSARAREKK